MAVEKNKTENKIKKFILSTVLLYPISLLLCLICSFIVIGKSRDFDQLITGILLFFGSFVGVLVILPVINIFLYQKIYDILLISKRRWIATLLFFIPLIFMGVVFTLMFWSTS